jgi:hypothetical protein
MGCRLVSATLSPTIKARECEKLKLGHQIADCTFSVIHFAISSALPLAT